MPAPADVAAPQARRIVLVHGLWMPRLSMAWHARRLQAAGYDTELFGYSSVVGGPEAALPALVETLRTPADVLAHSLGGLMVVQALQRHPKLPVRRVVCLGSPLCGSAAAHGLTRLSLGAASLGRSAGLLCQGCVRWQGAAEIGVIAGQTPLGLGRMFGRFAGPSDGTVAVAETCLDGLADHVVIETSHSGLLVSAQAAAQALAFLQHGRFLRPG